MIYRRGWRPTNIATKISFNLLVYNREKVYSKDKWNSLVSEMDNIFAEFAARMKDGKAPDSAEAQDLVKALQDHITKKYYACTNEILAGLGQMYVLDERFKNNIDKHADFAGKAIQFYCKKQD